MLKKLLMLLVALGLSLSAVIATAVEVNTADEAALESVKGIGPVHAKAIIDERAKNGPFRSADDLAERVKGIGPKSVQNLEAAGLTINGSSAAPSGKTATARKPTRTTRSAGPAATPAPVATPTPAATQAPTAATPTAAPGAQEPPATAKKPRRSRKKANTAAGASAITPSAATAATATGAAAASDGKATHAKRTRKSRKAAAAAAASS